MSAADRIAVLDVREGDTVVVLMAHRLDDKQRAQVTASVQPKLPANTKVLVLDAGTDLTVVRQSQGASDAAVLATVLNSAPGAMLQPIENEHTNTMLGAPRDWDEARDGKCIGLPVHRDKERGDWHSYWRPSPADLALLASGMPIRLTVFGTAHPPVAIAVRDDVAG